MKKVCFKAVVAAWCLVMMGWAGTALAAGSTCLLKEGGRLAVIGDSITEQKIYSNFIETYLAVCHPELKQDVCQFGWSGERAAGYLGRMDNDTLSWFKPDAATLCYGMNDGGYVKLTPEIAKGFETPSRGILEKFKAIGTATVLGGPGAVDTKYYAKGGANAATIYNENLAGLSDIAAKIAPEYGATFVPLHQTMMDAMAKAKAANGADFSVCGGDGVHPGPDGHLAMAYVFLKGLGVDGDIASIVLNYPESKATVSAGQKVLSVKAGAIELESARYPFCFFGGAKEPSTTAMLAFIPFNDEMNRFMFKVDGLPWAKAKVTWGEASKTFTKEELEKGVNLAAAFAEANPFKDAFTKVSTAVGTKQAFETVMIKSYINGLKVFADDPECKATIADFKTMMMKKRAALVKAVGASMMPVKNTIKVEKAD